MSAGETLGQSLEMSLSPLYIKQATEKIGKYQLYEYQCRVRDSKAPVTIIDAPTGAGKTLASLLCALERHQDTSGAIFVYPTNQLIEDQAAAMHDLLEGLGYSVKIKNWSLVRNDQEETISSEQHINEYNEDDTATKKKVLMAVISGERLDKDLESNPSLLTSKGALVRHYFKGEAGYKIILTNPDFLDMLLRGRYKSANVIIPTIPDFGLLVLDEFHLYSGTTLARIIFLLVFFINAFDQIIISTATHNLKIKTVLEKIVRSNRKGFKDETSPPLDVITCESSAEQLSEEYQMVQHPIELTLIPLLKESVLYAENDVLKVKTIIMNLFKHYMENHQRYRGEVRDNSLVPVVGIFNSQFFCENLYKNLMESSTSVESENIAIERIHGLVPKSLRLNATQADILLGTSAIEVGIDFNTPYLCIEGHDAATFLQRLGRGGRKQETRVVALIPQHILNRIRAKLADEGYRCEPLPDNSGQKVATVVPRDFFNEKLINETFPTLDSHVEFLYSQQALKMWIAFYLTIVVTSKRISQPFSAPPYTIPCWWRNQDLGIKTDLEKLLLGTVDKQYENRMLIVPPFWDQEAKKEIIKNKYFLRSSSIWSMLNSNLRGTASSIATYWPKIKVFSQINILDLPKLKIKDYYHSIQEFLKKYNERIPRSIRQVADRGIFIIDDFKMGKSSRSVPKVVVNIRVVEERAKVNCCSFLNEECPETTCIVGSFINVDDDNVEEAMLRYLDGELVIIVEKDKIDDWRLPRLLINNSHKIVIYGPDALLAEYILRNKAGK